MSPTLLSSALTSLLLFESAYSAVLMPRAAADFGDCTNPTIAYVKGVDGLRGYGYKPVNQKDFPHGAATEFTAIADFICGRLQNECLAPTATAALCRLSALGAKVEKEQKAVDWFNENIMQNINPTPSPAPKPKPKPTPTPQPKRIYNIETKISSRHVLYDGDLDLRWWFDNRMKTDDPRDGATCPVDDFPMGNKKAIRFTCSFPDGSVEKLLRTAMNELIQNSVTDASISVAEKPFARFEEKPGPCNRGGCPKPKPYSKFPAVGDMRLFNLTGERNEEQGVLHYEIVDTSSSAACKVCSYLAGTGAGAGGLAATVGAKLKDLAVGGLVGTFSGGITIACLLAC